MGQSVSRAAGSRGHRVVAMLGRSELAQPEWPEADVAIDFTVPDSAVSVAAACRERGLPLVSGTTGWEADMAAVEAAARAAGHAMVWAPNFSLGVHLFRKALERVAQELLPHGDFTASIHEVHHTGKLDAPSGTAKALGRDLEALGIGDVPITAERIAGVPGTHTVEWRGPIDSIQLTHSALNREGFAMGAVAAAEWLVRHPGPFDRIFGLEDVWG